MFFLKNESLGLKKKNIIYIKNFIDPTTIKTLKKNAFKIDNFLIHANIKKLSKDIIKIQKIYNNYILKIKKNLNYDLKTKINLRLLHLILSKWLYSYISNSYYRYLILLEIKKKYPKCAVVDIIDKSIEEEDKFFLQPNTSILNFALTKDIAQELNIKILAFSFIEIKNFLIYSPSSQKKLSKLNLWIIIKIIISKISIIITKFLYKKVIFIHDGTLSLYNSLHLIFKSNFKFAYLYFFEKYLVKDNFFFNNPLNKIKPKNFFEKILFKNSLTYLPKNLEVLFYYLILKIKKKNKEKIKYNNIIISKRFFSSKSFYFKNYIINNFNFNKLVAYQHGGAYGQEKYYFPEQIEKKITDYFATWGKIKNNSLFLPLSYEKNNKKKKELKCLFVVSSISHNFFSFIKNTELTAKFQMYPTYKLIEKISKKMSVTLRLPPYNHSWREKEFYSKIKNIKIDDHKNNFKSQVLMSDLVIHNHFNTTALETISLNIPTVIFNHKNLNQFNKDAELFLKKLIKKNIFFYNYKNLYEFLKKENFNLQNWWYQKEVQNVRDYFCNKYIHRSKDWSKQWINKLSKL